MDFNTIVQDQNAKEDQDVYVNQNQPAVLRNFTKDLPTELWAKEQIHAVHLECVVQVLVIHVQNHVIPVVIHAIEFHAVIHALIHVSFFLIYFYMIYGFYFCFMFFQVLHTTVIHVNLNILQTSLRNLV